MLHITSPLSCTPTTTSRSCLSTRASQRCSAPSTGPRYHLCSTMTSSSGMESWTCRRRWCVATLRLLHAPLAHARDAATSLSCARADLERLSCTHVRRASLIGLCNRYRIGLSLDKLRKQWRPKSWPAAEYQCVGRRWGHAAAAVAAPLASEQHPTEELHAW